MIAIDFEWLKKSFKYISIFVIPLPLSPLQVNPLRVNPSQTAILFYPRICLCLKGGNLERGVLTPLKLLYKKGVRSERGRSPLSIFLPLSKQLDYTS